MTLKEKEQLRNIILLILEAGRPGLTLREISNKAQLRDFNNPDSDFEDALDWLTAHGFPQYKKGGHERGDNPLRRRTHRIARTRRPLLGRGSGLLRGREAERIIHCPDCPQKRQEVFLDEIRNHRRKNFVRT